MDLGWRPPLRVEAIASRLEVIVLRLEAIATRVEAIGPALRGPWTRDESVADVIELI